MQEMGFFSFQDKRMAKKHSLTALNRMYKESEAELMQAALNGNISELNKAMKKHHAAEYAKLYQKTPEFKKRKEKFRRRH